jgi:hypothetical protein
LLAFQANLRLNLIFSLIFNSKGASKTGYIRAKGSRCTLMVWFPVDRCAAVTVSPVPQTTATWGKPLVIYFDAPVVFVAPQQKNNAPENALRGMSGVLSSQKYLSFALFATFHGPFIFSPK